MWIEGKKAEKDIKKNHHIDVKWHKERRRKEKNNKWKQMKWSDMKKKNTK